MQLRSWMIPAEACRGTFVTLKGACGKTTTTRWLPKLGVDTSPRPHAHRRSCYRITRMEVHTSENNMAVFKNLFNFRNIESAKFAMLLKNSSMILTQKSIKSTIEKMKFWRLGLN